MDQTLGEDNSNLSQETFAIDTWRAVKPGLHTVVTIAEHASNDAPKRILRLSTCRLQIFLVKYEYLRSLQLCEDQGIREKLKNGFASVCLGSLRLIWRPWLNILFGT